MSHGRKAPGTRVVGLQITCLQETVTDRVGTEGVIWEQDARVHPGARRRESNMMT